MQARNHLGDSLDQKGEKLVNKVERAIASSYSANILVNEFRLDVKPVNKLESIPEPIAALQRENAQLREQLEAALSGNWSPVTGNVPTA